MLFVVVQAYLTIIYILHVFLAKYTSIYLKYVCSILRCLVWQTKETNKTMKKMVEPFIYFIILWYYHIGIVKCSTYISVNIHVHVHCTTYGYTFCVMSKHLLCAIGLLEAALRSALVKI